MLVLRDWRRFDWWRGLCLALVLVVLVGGKFDRALANAVFYDPTRGWLGAGSGAWWAHGIIHSGGRWLVRVVVLAALALWAASFVLPGVEPWRRELTFIVVGMFAVILITGLLKRTTNIDCPWSLEGFGGTRPYITLFGDRPDALPHAACFPGAHSGSGFALLALYFALRERARRWAIAALVATLIVGATFAIGQEARGAHFLSHDVASAVLAWLVLVGLDAWLLAPRQRYRRAIE